VAAAPTGQDPATMDPSPDKFNWRPEDVVVEVVGDGEQLQPGTDGFPAQDMVPVTAQEE